MEHSQEPLRVVYPDVHLLRRPHQHHPHLQRHPRRPALRLLRRLLEPPPLLLPGRRSEPGDGPGRVSHLELREAVNQQCLGGRIIISTLKIYSKLGMI